jgi:hypothetical protein
MALSTEEQVLLDHLLAKQREEKEKNPEKFRAEQVAAARKKLYVFKVLDASSSMGPYISTTIETYNESLDALKDAQADVYVTLIEFSSIARVKHRGPFEESPRLTHLNYRPSGMTALLDAIGLAFEEADKFTTDYNTSFLLEVLTDGEENVSKNYTRPKLRNELLRRKETGQWTVTVMGPKGSVDIFTDMGVEIGNIAQFDVNSDRSRKGVTRLMAATAQNYVSTLNSATGSVAVNAAYATTAGVGGAAAADVDSWLDQQQQTGISK